MRRALLAALLAGSAAPLAAQQADSTLQAVLANGYRFAYRATGSGQPMVLIHDELADHRAWDSLQAEPSPGLRLVAYSRRYHAPNPWRPDDPPFGFEASAADLAAFIRALRLERPVLLGHGWGGLVALQTAIRYPDLLGGLVLAEPVADSLIPETSSRARISLAVREAYKAGVAADPARNPSGAVRAFLDASAGGIPWDLRPAREREMLLANAHTLPSSAAPEPGISCAQLAGIGVPVLLVRGDTTSPRRRLTMDGLAACLPDQAPAIIPGAGHDFPVTHATAFLAAVQQRFGALPH